MFLFQSGPYYNGARWYSPDLGRYLSSEPLLLRPGYPSFQAQRGASSQSYAYANNDPMRWVDRTGLYPDDSPGWDRWAEASRQMSDEEKIFFAASAGITVVASFAIAAGIEAGALSQIRLAAAAALKKAGDVCRNISIDGPSPGVWYGNGRIIGFRWKGGEWGARLDLHPMPGSGGRPILHGHIGPMGEHNPIPIADPVQWWNSP
jgi:RHS repeat-associated protein